MSALPNTFASSRPLSPSPRVESAKVESPKPVASIHHLRPVPSRQAAPRGTGLFALPKEPEDARITGGTRSLDRRLLALNLSGSRFTAAEN
jgi:hypothetical protein